MRLLLQAVVPSDPAPPFLQLILQQDLFGGWELLRESGRIGGRSTLRRERFTSREQALAALERLRDQYLGRGWRLTFSQGEAPPSGYRG
ncbi:MAG: hypothetical protein KatS3mg125_1213 [Lysobacterales bacterium]|jgi:predicted DNA-binding WGR domain protein|nr:MAG: hypothetical protein KatS3mg125_1213 [Xanthomonadales bacterium]